MWQRETAVPGLREQGSGDGVGARGPQGGRRSWGETGGLLGWVV